MNDRSPTVRLTRRGLGVVIRPVLFLLCAATAGAAQDVDSASAETARDVAVSSRGNVSLVLIDRSSASTGIPGVIHGVVRDSASGAPIVRARVIVVGTTIGAWTAPDGSYRVTGVPAGVHIVRARAMGYRPGEAPAVARGSDAALDIMLSRFAVTLEEVVVTPGRYTLLEKPLAQQTTLSRDDLRTMPQLGDDVYRAVNRLPGMASNELSAKFWVRGGSNDELLVRLDGLELYEPFHLKDFDGSLSIIDVQAVNGVELLTGGFPADYGNRLTGVFNLRTAQHPVTGVHPSAAITLGNARVAARGGLGGGRGQWMVSMRRGYMDVALNLFNIALAPEQELSPRYYDGLGTLRYRFNDRHSMAFDILLADDRTTYADAHQPSPMRSAYGSGYIWSTWHAELSARLKAETVVSAGRLSWRRRGAGIMDWVDTTAIDDDRRFRFAGLRQDWTLSLSDRHLIRWGGEARAMDSKYRYHRWRQVQELIDGVVVRHTDSARAWLDPNGSTLGGFLVYRVRPVSPLTLELGARADRQSYVPQWTLSPRASLAYAVGRGTTIRAAWGYYFQPQQLFQLAVQDGDSRFYRAELANQRTIGIDRRFANGVSVTIEAYQRRLSRLRPRALNIEEGSSPFAEVEGDRTRVFPSSGEARGVEAFVRRRGGARWDWSLSYSLARADDRIGTSDVPRQLDQRHTLYLELGYRPTAAWSLAWAWQCHTGWPFTPSSFRLVLLADGQQRIIHEYGPLNSVRLPAYHRMDARVSRRFRVGRGDVRAFVDVFNVYNRKNPRAYFYNMRRASGNLVPERMVESLLPVLPTFGVSIDF